MPDIDPIETVTAIYVELEQLTEGHQRDCRGRTTCCQFLLTGKTPMLTAGEAMVAAKAVRASGRKKLPASSDSKTGRCPLLGKDNRCTIYADRPFGCRTHYCAPAGGPLPRKALQHLIHRLEAVGESLGDTDPRPLQGAIEKAMGDLPPKRHR